jgi:hypothetical protein
VLYIITSVIVNAYQVVIVTIVTLLLYALDVLRQDAYVLLNNQVVAVAVCLDIISINPGALSVMKGALNVLDLIQISAHLA